MHWRSSISAGASCLDREARIRAVRAAAARAAARVPSIRRVVLFGSFARGIPTPRSDADLLVILDSSPNREPRDRVPAILRALSPLPCPLDLFVVTIEEVERGRADGSPLLREALAVGIDLL